MSIGREEGPSNGSAAGGDPKVVRGNRAALLSERGKDITKIPGNADVDGDHLSIKLIQEPIKSPEIFLKSGAMLKTVIKLPIDDDREKEVSCLFNDGEGTFVGRVTETVGIGIEDEFHFHRSSST